MSHSGSSDPSPPGTTTAARTRARILDAAAVLLAKDFGASLAEIGAAAGVGRTTLHRYFPAREDLVRALAVDSMAHVRQVFDGCRLAEGSAPEVLARLADAVLPLAAELRILDAGTAVWDLPELRAAWDEVSDSLDGLVERGQRDGDLRADVPAPLVVESFVGALWATGEAIREGRVAPAGASRQLVALLLDGARRERRGRTDESR